MANELNSVKCTKCGAEISEGAKFCSNCGAKVIEMDESPNTSPKKHNGLGRLLDELNVPERKNDDIDNTVENVRGTIHSFKNRMEDKLNTMSRKIEDGAKKVNRDSIDKTLENAKDSIQSFTNRMEDKLNAVLSKVEDSAKKWSSNSKKKNENIEKINSISRKKSETGASGGSEASHDSSVSNENKTSTNNKTKTIIFAIILILLASALADNNSKSEESNTVLYSEPNATVTDHTAVDLEKEKNESLDTAESDAQESTKDNVVYYSTNDKDTVKNGNAGVYAYRSRGGEYYTYFIINFDESYVYSFFDGNEDEACLKGEIISGTLNDVLVVTYNEGGNTWSEGMCFKYKNQPNHLIVQDHAGFAFDFYATDLDDALKLLKKKTIFGDDTEIDTPTAVESSTQESNKDNSVYYSTNDKDTVKNGNAGIYAYRSRGGEYYTYFIINFDEGYVYFFCDGNGEETGDKAKIVSGTLNDVLIVTYHDGGDTWSYGFSFKWKNQPNHLIVQDNDYFEHDFYATDLDDALKLLEKKTIYEY